MRLLLLSGLLVVVFVLARAALRHLRAQSRKPIDKEGGAMLRCEHCGVFVPADEALLADNHVYCSQAHRDLAREQRRQS